MDMELLVVRAVIATRLIMEIDVSSRMIVKMMEIAMIMVYLHLKYTILWTRN